MILCVCVFFKEFQYIFSLLLLACQIVRWCHKQFYCELFSAQHVGIKWSKLGPAVSSQFSVLSSHISPVLYLKSGAAGPDWSWLGKRHLVSAVCPPSLPPSLPPYLHLPQYLCLQFLQELQLIHMSVKY